jgi:hypothetical protein
MPLLDDPARLRRIMLWVMLGALAASGLLAVVGVVSPNSDDAWRMVGSGIAAVIAAGLMLAACKLLDSEKTRRTGLFVLATIAAQFVLILLALWDPLRNWSVRESDEKQWLTAVLFTVAALPSILFFYVNGLRGGRVAGTFGIIGNLASYALFLIATWTSAFNLSAGDECLWETAWGIWFFTLVVSASLAGVGIDRRYWRWLGLPVATAALAIALRNVWSDTDRFVNLLTVLITLAIIIGHTNIVFLCALKGRQEWLRWATLLCTLFAGAAFDYTVIDHPNDDGLWRIASAGAICAACATVALGILAAFNRKSAPHTGDGIEAAEISVVCPNCHKKQSVPLTRGIGETPCTGCGMIFSIRIRPPRCATCGYLLLMFKGEACPECGAKVSRPTGELQTLSSHMSA